jgi:cytochrome c556
MIRKLLVVFAILMLGVAAAAAQSSCQDVIVKRQTMMKHSAAVAKDGSAMIKGDAPFDLAKVQQIFATFAEDAAALPTLFPDCSKTGDDTTAGPAIWSKPDDFKAAIAKFAADIKTAQDSTKDLDGLKANFQTIGKDCGSCHQTFRVGKS